MWILCLFYKMHKSSALWNATTMYVVNKQYQNMYYLQS